MKQSLRRNMLQKRNTLNSKDIHEKSHSIAKKILHLEEYINSSSIFCFLSFGSEVETMEILEQALQTKKVYVPYINKEDDLMYPVQIHHLDDFEINHYGIKEPRKRPDFSQDILSSGLVDKSQQKEASPGELVLVPGVAFDSKGFRIGYGKGYYDKFFNRFSVKTKIALAFDLQIVEKVPSEDHDVPVDMIVTESNLITIS